MNRIVLLNRQSARKMLLKKIRANLKKILVALNRRDCGLTVVFCDDRFIRGLNKKYFGKDRPTDVIAFPSGRQDYLGDIVVCVQQAAAVCAAWGNTCDDEILLYLVHGLLHLLGYDDTSLKKRSTMERKQRLLINRLKNGTARL